MAIHISHPGWQRAAENYLTGNLAAAIGLFPRHCRNEQRLVTALHKGADHRRAVLGMPHKLLRLYLSAYQSQLFDRLVDMRLSTLERLWPGDLAWKHSNGASFKVTDPDIEQPRADLFEISPTAPMYGYKVTLATGQAGLLEESLLDKEQLKLESFRLGTGLAMPGERRPLRVPIKEVRLEQQGKQLELSFALPKGSFATAVLAEVMKEPAEDPSLTVAQPLR